MHFYVKRVGFTEGRFLMAGISSRMSILPDGRKPCMHEDESVSRGELAQASNGDPCVLARGSYVVPVDIIVKRSRQTGQNTSQIRSLVVGVFI
jgi:hypothetical protein